MKRRWIALLAGGLVAGCGITPAQQDPVSMSPAATGYRVQSTTETCVSVVGSGDAHFHDYDKLFVVTVSATGNGSKASGTVSLYAQDDMIKGGHSEPNAEVYEGTVKAIDAKDGRAVVSGTLTSGESFKLTVVDRGTSPTESPDSFSFNTKGANYNNAHLHEGDFALSPAPCL